MPTDRCNPKRRRLENIENLEGFDIEYAFGHGGGRSSYPAPPTEIAAPLTNFFHIPSYTPYLGPSSESNLYSQPIPTLAHVSNLLPDPLAIYSAEQFAWPQGAAIALSTTACTSVPGAPPTGLLPSRHLPKSQSISGASTNGFYSVSEFSHDGLAQDPRGVVCFGEVSLSAK